MGESLRQRQDHRGPLQKEQESMEGSLAELESVVNNALYERGIKAMYLLLNKDIAKDVMTPSEIIAAIRFTADGKPRNQLALEAELEAKAISRVNDDPLSGESPQQAKHRKQEEYRGSMYGLLGEVFRMPEPMVLAARARSLNAEYSRDTYRIPEPEANAILDPWVTAVEAVRDPSCGQGSEVLRKVFRGKKMLPSEMIDALRFSANGSPLDRDKVEQVMMNQVMSDQSNTAVQDSYQRSIRALLDVAYRVPETAAEYFHDISHAGMVILRAQARARLAGGTVKNKQEAEALVRKMNVEIFGAAAADSIPVNQSVINSVDVLAVPQKHVGTKTIFRIVPSPKSGSGYKLIIVDRELT